MSTRRSLPSFLLGACLCLALTAEAYLPVARKRQPDLDRRFPPSATSTAAAGLASRGAGAAAARAAAGALQQRVPRVTVDFDPHFGTVASVRSTDTFLTPALAQSGTPLPAASPGLEPERVVRGFLDGWRALFGHGSEALALTQIKQQFIAAHNGLRTVVWQQEREALPVYGATLVAHVTARGELVNLASALLPNAQPSGPSKPGLSAVAAAAFAAAEVGGKVNPTAAQVVEPPVGPTQVQRLTAPGLQGEATAQLLWLPTNRTTLRLCWQVIFTPAPGGEMFQSLVDAATGEVQVRRCLTEYAADASFRVFTSDSPTPLSPGHGSPLTNQPPVVPRQLLTLAALSTNASLAGWIPDGVNETRGNNVDAHLDRNADNVADTPRPQGSPARVFDPPLDLSQSPVGQGDAAVVQLFYTCNWMHDRLYELGFTEAAGNFQITNFNRGGLGNDALQADAQDGSGTDNANMSTPPDGTAPRMQMYLFTGPTPNRDGDFDAEVVLHEYTHGLSNRRVGGGAGLSAMQSRGMGEGWSDWYALALLSEPGDDPDGIYASGAYVSYLIEPGYTQNYYFGIRRYPYTTDLNRNPLTFKDIDPGRASSHAGVPYNPLFTAPDANPSEVHNQGEVWCAMLWEVRASLLRKYGAAAGNQRALQLVTDALGLTPANPTFIQARDAVLQADLVNSGGEDRKELWAAFAKRGLGVNAVAPASSTTSGVVESFDPPDDLGVAPAGPFVSSGPVGGPFQPASFTLTLTNAGLSPLAWSLINTSAWLRVSSAGGTLEPAAQVMELTLSLSSTASTLAAGIYPTAVLFSNQSSRVVQARTVTLRVGLPEGLTELFSDADNDLDFQSFTFTPDGSPGFYSVCRQVITNFPTPPTDGARVSLPLDTIATLSLTSGARVSLFGSNYATIYVAAAGHLTFTLPLATNTVESLATHFNRPRVSALFDDLNPTTLGAVYWQQLSDRAVVSFVNVPEFGQSTPNNFQVEMFFDGRIRLSYLSVSATGGLIGLSAGQGMPAGFQESDFSSYGQCWPPLRLTLPAVATEGGGVLPAAGMVGLAEPVTTNVVISLRSYAPGEVSVPEQVVLPAGETNARFDVTILDDGLLDGSQRANVAASANEFALAFASVLVHDNERATLSVVLPPVVAEMAGTVSGAVTCSAAPDSFVQVSLASSDLAALRVPETVTFAPGQTAVAFTATVVDDNRIDGTQTVTVTPFVENWTALPATVAVEDNESLALGLALPASLVEDVGTQTNAGRVWLGGTLATNVLLTLTSETSLRLSVPTTVTIPTGQTSAVFQVSPVNNLLPDGDQSIAVSAEAAGFVSATNRVTVVDDDLAPILLTQPVGQTLYAGSSVSFSATAFGQKPLAWQWHFNGAPLAGKTNATLALTSLTTDQSGDYTVRVTNQLGQAWSQPATLTVQPIPPCLPPPADLVSWWRAESNTWDSAGFAHATTGGSNPLPYTPGKVGTAFYCLISYYAVPAAAAPNLGTNAGFTIEGWIRPATVDTAGNPVCEWSPGATTPTGFGVAFGLAPSNGMHVLRANLRDAAGASHILAAAPGGFTNGTWSHVALTYDRASGVASLFRDGTMVAQASLGSFLARTEGRFLIGGGTSLAYQTPVIVNLRGAVDELSLYSRALEPAEIAAAYAVWSNGKCVPVPVCTPLPAGCVAWWRGESNTLDSVGLNFLRPTGSGVLAATYQPGVARTGFSLPMSSSASLLGVPSHPDLDLGAGAGMTIEGWFNVTYTGSFSWIADIPILRWSAPIDFGRPVTAALTLEGTSASTLYPLMQFGGLVAPYPTLWGTNLVVAPGRWNHLAMTFDKASGVAVMYVNGALAGQNNLGAIRPRTLGDLTFGSTSGFLDLGSLTGLDEVSFYSRALTAEEVGAIVRAGAKGKCQPVPQCSAPLDGLLAWWRGEGQAADSAGDHHAQTTTTNYVPGIVGRGFGQTTNTLLVPAAADLNLGAGSGLTLEAWVKAAVNSGTLPVFAWGSSNSPRGVSLSVLPSSSTGRAELRFTDAAGVASFLSTSNGTLGGYVWQHLAATYDQASGLAALYVNGRLLARTNLGSLIPQTMDDLYLGSHPSTGARFTGDLDELAVFDRALTEDEVRSLVLARDAGKCRVPPTVALQPTNLIGTVGSNATLSLAASGSARLRYQWLHAGVPISDATAATLVLTNVQPNHAGIYSAIVSNWFGTAPSSNALLTLNYPPRAGTLAAATFSNTPITISLGKLLSMASDPDGDPLTVSAVTPVSTQGGAVELGLLGTAYQPAASFVGLDRFGFTVSDGRGGAATGTVEVGVRPGGGLSGNMLPTVTLANGQLQVRFLGLPGRTYTVQRATQLPGPWTTLGTTQTSGSGLGLIIDAAPPAGQAFYRTVYP